MVSRSGGARMIVWPYVTIPGFSMAPNPIVTGTATWSDFSYGNGIPKYSSRRVRIVAVTSAAYFASAARPFGATIRTGTFFDPATPAFTNSNGPTANATR